MRCNVLLIFSLVVFMICENHAGQEDCEIGWDKFRENCYKFFKRAKTSFKKAETLCGQQGVGSHLVSICSDEEWDYITTKLMKKSDTKVAINVGLIMRGMKNMQPPPTIMRWTDKSKCTYIPMKGFIANESFNELSMTHDCFVRISWKSGTANWTGKPAIHDRKMNSNHYYNYVCKKPPSARCFERRRNRNSMIDMVKGNYLYLGKYGDNITACMEACKKNDKCKTFTLFNNKFRRPFFRGICLGRVDVLDQKQEEAIPNVITGVLIAKGSAWCMQRAIGLNIVFDKEGKVFNDVYQAENVASVKQCRQKCWQDKLSCQGCSFFGPNYRRPFWRNKCFLRNDTIEPHLLEHSDAVYGSMLRYISQGCFSIKIDEALFDTTMNNLKSSAIMYLGRQTTRWACLEACHNLENNKCRGFVWFSPSFRKPFWHNRCLGGLWDLNMTRVPMEGVVTGVRPQTCNDNFD